MLVCRNKKSGKYFIHIEDFENETALFVSPSDTENKPRILPLQLELFEEPEELEEEALMSQGLISIEQSEKYHRHREQNIDYWVKEMLAEYKKMTFQEREKWKKRGGDYTRLFEAFESYFSSKGGD
jgi:hypothetical protein